MASSYNTSVPAYLNPQSTTWNVDPNQTVANQITGLLSSSNPYITNARAQGTQGAASRGFLNGSMAAGASENAAINAALPIATSDASTYARAGETNASNATQQEIEASRAQAQIGAAGIGANASMYDARLSSNASMFNATTGANASMYGDNSRAGIAQNILSQQAQQYNANWAQQQAQHGWTVDASNQAQQNTTRNNMQQALLQTYVNDPSSFLASSDGGYGANSLINSNFSRIFGVPADYTGQANPSLPSGYGIIPVPAPYGP